MKSADLVGPERDCHPAPLGQNRGMMALFFRQRTDPIGKSERFGEIREFENALQSSDSFAFNQGPLRNLGLELLDLGLGHQRRIAAAGGALLSYQCTHDE